MGKPRNSKGQFKKGHSGHHAKKRSKSGNTTAIVVSPPRTITRTRTVAVAAPRRRRHHGGGGGGSDGKVKAEIGAWGSAIGYLEQNNASTFNQIPTFGKLPRTAVIAAVSFMFRKKSHRIDRLCTAAVAITGYKVGQQNFALTGDYDE